MASRNLVLFWHTVACTTYSQFGKFFGGVDFREIICIYYVLGCITDKLVVLILHGANPSKQVRAVQSYLSCGDLSEKSLESCLIAGPVQTTLKTSFALILWEKHVAFWFCFM